MDEWDLKNLEDSNKPLLAKQSWKVISNSNALCVKILKASTSLILQCSMQWREANLPSVG